MNPNRRDFLKTSLATGSLVSWGLTVPAFLCRAAAAAPRADQPGGKDTILVVVQLTGGNDGLNTIVPYADPEYAKCRQVLRVPTAQVLKINDQLGLHPAMGGMAKLLQSQALALVQGVGYPNPTLSHFRAMDIWHAASTAETLNEGWIGKALRGLPKAGTFHLASRAEATPMALVGAPTRVPSITSLEDFQLRTDALNPEDQKAQKKVIESTAIGPTPLAKPGAGSSSSLLEMMRTTAANTYDTSRRLQEVGSKYRPKVPYPETALGAKLKLAAQLIDGNLGARIFYVTHDGFDTHANQFELHAKLLGEMSDAMTAFYQDMAAQGHKDRVLMMTFSEFGRRAKENGSKGTDHGWAGPMLVVGGKIKAGLVGQSPDLTDLDGLGNLKYQIDFRRMYATVLDRWLGVDSKEVLGGTYQPVDILKS